MLQNDIGIIREEANPTARNDIPEHSNLVDISTLRAEVFGFFST